MRVNQNSRPRRDYSAGDFIFSSGDKMNEENEPKTTTMAETNNYMIWKAEEPDGETTYHIELNNVTLHFFAEEWKELVDLMHSLK